MAYVATEQVVGQDSLMGVNDLAAALRVHRVTVYRLLADGKIGPKRVRLGRRVLWVRSEVERWIAAHCPPLEKWEQMERHY